MASDAKREGRAARDTALAVRASDRAGILVRGADRSSWLNGLVTCDLAKLGPHDAAYGLLVEKKGKIQTDLVIAPSAESYVLGVPRELRPGILETLEHYLVMEDAELEASEHAFYQLYGPRSREILTTLAVPHSGSLDVIGTGGAVFAVPAEDEDAFVARLDAELARVGGLRGTEAAWDAVRIEVGLPRLGAEVDGTLYPQEASLEKVAVSFDKGCYLGQEVVYMLENRGHVKRKLVPLDVEGDAPLARGDAVTTPEGVAVGEVRSSVIGPVSEQPVAIAMVKWADTKPGTELRAGGRVARVRG